MVGGPKPTATLTPAMAQEQDLQTWDHLLYELARDLCSSLDPNEVLHRSMDKVIDLMRASRGYIVKVNQDTGELSVVMAGGETDLEKASKFLGSKTVIDQVVRTEKAVVSTDASLDDRFKGQQSVILQNLRSIIAVPLKTKGKVIGAVYVDNPFRAAIFEEKDKENLQRIADIIAMALDNADQYARSEYLRSLFERYINKQVTNYVLEHSSPGVYMLRGERREVTMLNSDIVGFSTLSQRMQPDEAIEFLNRYFARMIDIVEQHGGNIDKFQGDGMLVVFGAPNAMADHAIRAYDAAQEMIREVARFNRELEAGGYTPIAIGIGLDSGVVVAGTVGSDARLEYTLIGSHVNNSAFLSKVRPPRVLMTETTKLALPSGVRVIDYEPLVLKGTSDPQPIFQLEIEVTAG